MDFNHKEFLAQFEDPAVVTDLSNWVQEQNAALPEELQPQNALKDIFVTQADGTEKTEEQAVAEITTFFNRADVRADMAMLQQLEVAAAYACMFHAHGDAMYEAMSGALGNNHDHDHPEANFSHIKDTDHNQDNETEFEKKRRLARERKERQARVSGRLAVRRAA